MKTILLNQTDYLLWTILIQQTSTNPIDHSCMSDMCLNKYNVGGNSGFLWHGRKILRKSHPVSSHHLTDVVSSMCPMNFAERPNLMPKSPWTVTWRRYVSFNWCSESCVLNCWTQYWEVLNFPYYIFPYYVFQIFVRSPKKPELCVNLIPNQCQIKRRVVCFLSACLKLLYTHGLASF